MSESIGAAQVELGVDASGVEAGVSKAKKTIDSLGESAAKVSKGAGKELAGMGEAGAKGADKLDAATRRSIAAIEKQTAVLGKSGSAWWEAYSGLKGNTAALEPYIAKLKEAEQANRKFGDSFGGIEKVISTAAVAMAGRVFVGWIDGAIEAADRMNDLTKSTDLSAESLAGLKLAAQQSGSDLDSVAKSINKLSLNIGKDSKHFEDLGISAKKPIEAFKQLADQYNRIIDPQLRAAYAAEALGKSWEGAVPLLAEGSKGIQSMINDGTGLSKMTTDFAKASDDFNDKVSRLKTSLGGTATLIASDLLPVMKQVTVDLTDMASRANDSSNDFSPLTETFRTLVVLAGNVGFVFNGVGRELGGLAAQVAAIGNGDFSGAARIGEIMKEDAENARSAFDAWEKRMMSAGKTSTAVAVEVENASNKMSKAEESALRNKLNPEAGKKSAAEAAAVIKEQYTARIESIKQGLSAEENMLKLAHERGLSDEIEFLQQLEEAQQQSLGKRASALQEQLSNTTDKSDRAKLIGEIQKIGSESVKAFGDMESAVARAQAASKKLMDTLASADWKDAIKIADDNKAMQDELATINLSAEALDRYKVAKIDAARDTALADAANLDAAALIYEANKLDDAATAVRNMAAARRELAANLSDSAQLTARINGIKKEQSEGTAMWKSIEDAAHDTWRAVTLNGENAFKSIGKTLKSAILDVLYQMTIKKWIINIGASVSGAGVASAAFGASEVGAGGTASSSLGQLGSIASIGQAIKTGYTTLAGNATASWNSLVGNSVGESLGLSAYKPADVSNWTLESGGSSTAGGYETTASGTAWGNAAGQAFVAYAGNMAGNAVSGEYRTFGDTSLADVGSVVGAAVASYFSFGLGAGVGSAIGSVIGGAVDRVFGRAPPKVESSGVRGTFSGSDFSGVSYADIKEKGGYLRSDKWSHPTAAITGDFDKMLDTSFTMLKLQTGKFADALGVDTASIASYTKAIDISMKGLDAAGQQKAITDMFTGIGEDLAMKVFDEVSTVQVPDLGNFAGGFFKSMKNGMDFENLTSYIGDATKTITVITNTWKTYAKEGETASTTLQRLGGSLMGVNQLFGQLHQTLLPTSIAGGDAASKLLDMNGGISTFTSKLSTYYDNFYTDEQRRADTISNLTTALDGLGYTMPDLTDKTVNAREEFRAWVEEQGKLVGTSDAARATYTALLDLVPAFASVTDAITTTVDQISQAVLDARQSWQDKLDILTGTRTQTQVSQSNDLTGVTDETTRTLIKQVYAQQALNDAAAAAAEAAKAAAAAQADAAASLAATIAQIAQERTGLETRLLQLQGNTAELRARELAAIDPANQALQKQIWLLEDAQSAQEAYSQSLAAANSRLVAAQNAVASAVSAIESIRAEGTNRYLAALGDVASAQTRIADIQLSAQIDLANAANEAARGMADLGEQLRDFIDSKTLSPSQNFGKLLTAALAGDKSAMQALPGAAGTAIDVARNSAASQLDFSRAQADILAKVAQVATLAEAAGRNTMVVPGKTDPLAEAQTALTAAQTRLADALTVANTIGAPLAASVTDLIGKYATAQADMVTAAAELSAAQKVLADIQTNTLNTAANTNDIKFGIATTLAGKFDALDSSIDGLLSFDEFKTGFTGLASDATLQNIFNELDANGDGVITKLESIRAGIVTTLAGKFDALDSSLDGLLNYSEFSAAFAGLASDATLKNIFNELDANGDGTLNKLESIGLGIADVNTSVSKLLTFSEFKTQFSGLATDAKLQTIFNELDANGDGSLSALEMIEGYTKTTSEKDLTVTVTGSSGAFDSTDPIRSVFDAIKENTAKSGGGWSSDPVIWNYDATKRAELAGVIKGISDKLTNGVLVKFDRGTYDEFYNTQPGGSVFAKGGAFTNGIVTRPTSFDIGKMGEAGPEAIMPLTNIGGRLGVHASSDPAVRNLLEKLVAEVESLRAEARATARSTAKTASYLDSVISGEETLQTEARLVA